jgi:hypothetical protein
VRQEQPVKATLVVLVKLMMFAVMVLAVAVAQVALGQIILAQMVVRAVRALQILLPLHR